MPTRRPASAKARLSGRPTWPPPPRTTTSRSGEWFGHGRDSTSPVRAGTGPKVALAPVLRYRSRPAGYDRSVTSTGPVDRAAGRAVPTPSTRSLEPRAVARSRRWGLLLTFILVTAERLLGAYRLRHLRDRPADLPGGRRGRAHAVATRGRPASMASRSPARRRRSSRTCRPRCCPRPSRSCSTARLTLVAALVALRAAPAAALVAALPADQRQPDRPRTRTSSSSRCSSRLPRLAALAVVFKIYAAVPLALHGRWRALVDRARAVPAVGAVVADVFAAACAAITSAPIDRSTVSAAPARGERG